MNKWRKRTFRVHGKQCRLTNSPYDVSIHHIKPKRDGGRNNVMNTIPITQDLHMKFNYIELHMPELAERINKVYTDMLENTKQLQWNEDIVSLIDNVYGVLKELNLEHPIILKHSELILESEELKVLTKKFKGDALC